MTSSRRSDLQGLVGYHSAQVDVAVRLNTNEAPLPPPEGFARRFLQGLDEIALNRYPDRDATALRSALAHLEGVVPSNIYCANGSNEVLQTLFLAYGGAGQSALIFEPTYALHSHIARITGTTVITHQRDEQFDLTANEVAESIESSDPALTFFCSPNNPTGLSESVEAITAALEVGTGLVVVDEAYGQFASHRAQDLFGTPGSDRLVVVKTFSKTWALAGLRLGYAMADDGVIAACTMVGLPYHLSSLTQVAGLAALGDLETMQERTQELTAERIRLAKELESLPLDVWPSEANFILFRPLTKSGHDVWKELVDRSVLVRDCSSWPRLENCLRVTVGTREQDDLFLEALKEIL